VVGTVQFKVDPRSSRTQIWLVNVSYNDDHAPRTSGHKWHIHNMSVAHSDCTTAGGHWDPCNKERSQNYSCVRSDQTTCFAGDLSGKYGPMNLPANSSHQMLDTVLSSPSSVVGKSIVVHGPNGVGTKLACGTICSGLNGCQPNQPPPPTPTPSPPPRCGGSGGGPSPPPHPSAPAKCSTLSSCTAPKVKDSSKDNMNCAGTSCSALVDTDTCCSPPPPPPPVTGGRCQTCECCAKIANGTAALGTWARASADEKECLHAMLGPQSGGRPGTFMLPQLVEMLAECAYDVHDGAAKCSAADGGCDINADKISPMVPASAGTRDICRPHSCKEMFGNMKHCTADKDNAKSAMSGSTSCTTDVKWTAAGGTHKIVLGAMCDTPKQKLCYPAGCGAKSIASLWKNKIIPDLVGACYNVKQQFYRDSGRQHSVVHSLPKGAFTSSASCDVVSQFVGSWFQWLIFAVSIILIILSVLLVKVWYIVAIAKILLWIYVGIEVLLGGTAVIYSFYLFSIKALPMGMKLGTLSVGAYLLFVGGTFYKGMTKTPCLLNISFLAAAILALVCFVVGLVLAVSTEMCQIVEDKVDAAAGNEFSPDDIAEAKDTVAAAKTLIVILLFLIYGVAASSVILSMKMKGALRQEKKDAEAKEQLTVEKSEVRKEREDQAWADKIKKQVEKDEKKKRKK
jgi:Cu/Zn superoxide dismutase